MVKNGVEEFFTWVGQKVSKPGQQNAQVAQENSQYYDNTSAPMQHITEREGCSSHNGSSEHN